MTLSGKVILQDYKFHQELHFNIDDFHSASRPKQYLSQKARKRTNRDSKCRLHSCGVICKYVEAEWSLRSNEALLILELPMECLALANSNHPFQFQKEIKSQPLEDDSSGRSNSFWKAYELPFIIKIETLQSFPFAKPE